MLKEEEDDSLDYYRTEEIVCPYCKHEHEDSWDHGNIECGMIMECEQCEKTFNVSSEPDLYYYSSKINENKNE